MTTPAETFHAAWTETAHAAWQTAETSGFHEDVTDDRSYDIEKLFLVSSEVNEAFEEIRDGRAPTLTYFNDEKPTKPEGVPSELADAVIRIMDYAVIRGIDLAAAIEQKMAYNATREYKHGRQF